MGADEMLRRGVRRKPEESKNKFKRRERGVCGTLPGLECIDWDDSKRREQRDEELRRDLPPKTGDRTGDRAGDRGYPPPPSPLPLHLLHLFLLLFL
jgi:hypothetical protein